MSSRFLFYPAIFLLVILFCAKRVSAQVSTEQKESEPSVLLHVDPRLTLLSTYQESVRVAAGNAKALSGMIRSGKGYRVMIYSGTDRAKANSTKADFMRRYPGIRVYMTYALPQYRIKVGDYTSRQEAHELYNELSGTYSPCMVVPDIIEINTFRKNDTYNTSEGK